MRGSVRGEKTRPACRPSVSHSPYAASHTIYDGRPGRVWFFEGILVKPQIGASCAYRQCGQTIRAVARSAHKDTEVNVS